MKEITILLTRYSDWISSFVYHIAGHGYTHASLGLGGGVYYSFNYRGFCEETLEKHRRRGVEQSLSCVLAVSDQAYQDIQARIKAFQRQRAEYRYPGWGCSAACCGFHSSGAGTISAPSLWRRC